MLAHYSSILQRIFVIAIFLGVPATTLATPLLLLSQYDRELYSVDTDSLGTPTLVGSIGFGTDVIELTATSPDLLYAFDRTSNSLISVSPTDGSVRDVVGLDQDIQINPRGFDISPSGELFGVLPQMELRTINASTGVTTLMASLSGAQAVEAIAFSDNGTLYATGAPVGASSNMGTHLYTIDITTGLMSLIGNIGLEIDTLGFGADGYLYGAWSGPGRTNLYQIDTQTASLMLLGDTGVNSIVWISAFPEAVPEPATLALMGLGLAGIGFARKKKAA